MERHPCAVGSDKFEEENRDLFEGRAEGQYLRNRLLRAYQQGWFDHEKMQLCGALLTGISARCVNPEPCAIPGHAS